MMEMATKKELDGIKIKLKDLQRVYNGRECVSFFYTVEVENYSDLVLHFTRVTDYDWYMSTSLIISEGDEIEGSIPISFVVHTPKKDFPLVNVTSWGMEMLKNRLNNIAQVAMRSAVTIDGELYGV